MGSVKAIVKDRGQPKGSKGNRKNKEVTDMLNIFKRPKTTVLI
jgi:hypothetical protein